MAPDRQKAGSDERGSVSLELVGALPVVLLAILVAAQLVVAGAALWSAGVAARAGARAVLTGKQPRGAAERALPGVLQGGLKVTRDEGVRVGVRVPGLIPGLPETHVYGSSSLGGG
ncbi:MAG: hypothetical protein QG596_1056 [Actinomycetota bacterium]|jgi:hypothetical protein|nr:hypothetical protein [Actinomycetota bacterium]